MSLLAEGLDLHSKCCIIVEIIEVRSRSHTRIRHSLICRHDNAKECAATAGYTLNVNQADMSHMCVAGFVCY